MMNLPHIHTYDIPRQITQPENMNESVDIINLDSTNNDLLAHIDPDINYDIQQARCKYYNSEEFTKTFKQLNNLSIFHSNIRSSAAHISVLC